MVVTILGNTNTLPENIVLPNMRILRISYNPYFLGAASPGAGAGAAVAGAGAAAAAQPKLLHFDDGQRERVAIFRTRRCAS